MVEPAKREATMEEIVVALRETRNGAAKTPSLSIVGDTGPQRAPDTTAIAEQRDREIERLLKENAHLNERVMSLLKDIEREQARGAEQAVARVVRETIEAELRPIMAVLLGLLEKQRPRLPAASHDGHWIVDLDREPHR